MNWKKTSIILCLFGFVKEFRPSEPFVTSYFTGSWKNFTSEQVNQEIYPYGTYSNLAFLIFIFLMTDFLRYKPVIILCGLSGTATFLTLLLGKSLIEMQIVEILYGLFISTEVAYYTYMYAAVDKTHYQKVTGFTRAAFLFGRFLSGVVAQLTVSYGLLDYEQLLYLTISALGLSTVWAFLLPGVKGSIYFHRVKDSENLSHDNDDIKFDKEIESSMKSPKSKNILLKLKQAYILLWKDFLKAFTNSHVVKWSLWWAFATCGYVQVLNYVQLVWETAYGKDKNKIFNGAVEALYTIIGAVSVFGVGTLRINWSLFGEITLSIFSFIEGILLFVSYKSYDIWLLYGVYVAFGVIYHTVITVASFEVAKHLSEDSYSLVFGINTFLALVLQSLLTFLVAGGNVFILDIRQQFLVYSGYFGVLGLIFMIMALFTIINYRRQGRSFQFWLHEERAINES
ncbi:thiamine transporter 2-like [Leptopilina boulardi]|uniref:thiamine transporter 2-like n=1 Tax=Leptopilina boulardi TaxID=63433 RepID=UPI0021F62F70|nr:thiamine transporter 2-like [Leptopilina boulardi]XP_051174615.1 thiamine transporter 2-like [Leptopilina boulardi]XP_051174616.1 thiamine transporter 2-like [Leptopilina boulardi]XP_051174617.1 thiamine transporter 2-like [Leptopilina boulardi]